MFTIATFQGFAWMRTFCKMNSANDRSVGIGTSSSLLFMISELTSFVMSPFSIIPTGHHHHRWRHCLKWRPLPDYNMRLHANVIPTRSSRIHTKITLCCRKIKDQSNSLHSVRFCNIAVEIMWTISGDSLAKIQWDLKLAGRSSSEQDK